MRTSVLLLCSSLSLLACGPDSPQGFASVPSAIVNGSVDTGHPSVGMVRAGNSLCTGTLVGHRTVLTAAHCLKAGEQHRFVLGQDSYEAKQAIPHAAYDPNDFGVNDVAVLLLRESPKNVQYSRVYSKGVSYGKSVTLVGFGITGKDKSDSGVKRVGQNRVLWLGSMTYTFYTTWGSWAQVCNGDSGGPSFAEISGKELVVGVHSWTKGCQAQGNDMRSDVYTAWLKQVSKGDLATESSDPVEPPDTDAPTVTIVSPQEGTNIDTDLEVKAEVTDDGSVVEVRMYLDGTLTHNLKAPPYAFQMGLLKAGSHTVRVVAKDDAGNEGEASVTIKAGSPPPPPDTVPPSVSIIAPADGADVQAPYFVDVNASDDRGVTAVALAIDGAIVDTLTAAPYRFEVKPATPGPYRVEVRARDAAGNEATASSNIFVTNDPDPAPSTDEGGCSVSAPAPPFLATLALLALCALRRRRPR